ncbi:MAG: DUF2961 domain-containing protein [Candidatus Acidiferrales bacterium]
MSSSLVDGSSLAMLRDGRAGRESSFDRTGGNADWIQIPSHTIGKLAEIQGPGMITHIWISGSAFMPIMALEEPLHPIGKEPPRNLKESVLRIYWDGEQDPSVEVPIGDFFGQPLGKYVVQHSAMLSAPPWSGLNSYFPMPFAKSALVTLNNDRGAEIHIYSHIDYVGFSHPLDGVGYFHAQYRQYTPASQPDVEDFEVVTLEAEGRGHILGFSRGFVLGSQEQVRTARELLYIDGARDPLVDLSFRPNFGNTEEITNCSPAYHYKFEGHPYVMPGIAPNGQYYSYRWFIEGPPTFSRSAKAAIAARDHKSLGSELYSTAYWYQTEPHKKFPALPKLEDRVPRSLASTDLRSLIASGRELNG